MKKFEYESGNCSGNLHDLTDLMNLLGQEGWELVTANSSGYNTSYIVKRELKDESNAPSPPPLP